MLPMECTESEDSGVFTATLYPAEFSDNVVSYEWMTEDVYPEGAVFPTYQREGKPHLDFSNPTGASTAVKETRWHAPTGSRLLSENGSSVQYHLNCKVKIGKATVKARDRDGHRGTLIVNVRADMTEIWFGKIQGGVKGAPEAVPHNGKFILERNDYRRFVSEPIMNLLPTSQFYDKTLKHEEHHIKQWTEEKPWCDLYDVDQWWEDYFNGETFDTAEDAMDYWRAIDGWKRDQDESTSDQTEVDRELDAWHVSNAHPPDFLEMTDEEIKEHYKNQ